MLSYHQGSLINKPDRRRLASKERHLHIDSVTFHLPQFLLSSHAMNIYFCGSIRGGRQDVKIYQKIVKKLQTYGQVLTEHVSHDDITEKGKQFPKG